MYTPDIIASVWSRLDDDGTEFPTADVLRELRAAASDIMRDTIIKRAILNQTDSTSFPLVSGTEAYTLPSDFNYSVNRVVYNDASSSGRLLFPIEADQVYDYQALQGASVDYYAVRGDQIYVAGKPAAADSGIELTVWYAKTDSDFANDAANQTTLGKVLFPLLIDKTCSQLALKSPDLVAISQASDARYEKGFRKAQEDLDNLNDAPIFMDVTDEGVL